jgi:hypothetical protein
LRQSPRSSPTSQAPLKSGAFAPPALPGLDALTPLSDSRPWPPPRGWRRGSRLARAGLPCQSSSFPSDVPFPIPRRIEAVHLSMSSRPMLPSPSPWRVGIRIETFEACSGFTILRPIGSLSRPRRPLSRGSDPASRPAKPLVSYRTHRHLSGWNLPPLELRTRRVHTVNAGGVREHGAVADAYCVVPRPYLVAARSSHCGFGPRFAHRPRHLDARRPLSFCGVARLVVASPFRGLARPTISQ